MDEIDNILNQLEIPVTPTPQTNEGSSSISDEDIDNILEENNIESEGESFTIPLNSSDEQSEEIIEQPVVSEEEANVEDSSSEEQTSSNEFISSNSPTLLMDESTSRFSGAEWYNEIRKAKIIIAGIGGIGSNVAFQIARMSPASMILYDDDTVEIVNMAGQLFSMLDVGDSKVDAIAKMIYTYTSMHQVMAVQEKFTASTTPGDIMICGFDNMAARNIFFNSWVNHVRSKPDEEKGKCLYLDGRLSIDTLQVLCIKGDDEYNIMRYRKEFLFTDAQADATICSMKQTTYLACMIGSIIVNLFTNFIANQLNPVISYDLPFFTEYDAQNVIFKTEN